MKHHQIGSFISNHDQAISSTKTAERRTLAKPPKSSCASGRKKKLASSRTCTCTYMYSIVYVYYMCISYHIHVQCIYIYICIYTYIFYVYLIYVYYVCISSMYRCTVSFENHMYVCMYICTYIDIYCIYYINYIHKRIDIEFHEVLGFGIFKVYIGCQNQNISLLEQPAEGSRGEVCNFVMFVESMVHRGKW